MSGVRTGQSAARNVEVEFNSDRDSVTTPPRRMEERTVLEITPSLAIATQSHVSLVMDIISSHYVIKLCMTWFMVTVVVSKQKHTVFRCCQWTLVQMVFLVIMH